MLGLQSHAKYQVKSSFIVKIYKSGLKRKINIMQKHIQLMMTVENKNRILDRDLEKKNFFPKRGHVRRIEDFWSPYIISVWMGIALDREVRSRAFQCFFPI